MKKTIAIIALTLSIGLSFAYQYSDLKLTRILKSREWQSYVLVDTQAWSDQLKNLKQVEIRSNWKYLPNQTYLKGSNLTLFYKSDHEPVEIHIMETGNWELSDSYLLLEPTDFQDVTANPDLTVNFLNTEQIKQLFRVTSQQSRRLDVLNSNTLILTNLGQTSTLLFSRPIQD